MLFVLTARDKDGAGELRQATRAAHFDYVRTTNVLKLGGPFLDETGNMVGSLIIFEATDFDAAREWAANDPYARAGLFSHSEVTPWKATINNCGAQL